MFCLALNLARFRMSFLNRIPDNSLLPDYSFHNDNIFANVITIFHICNSGEPKGEGLDRAAYETVGKGLEGLVTIGAHTGVGAFEDGAGA